MYQHRTKSTRKPSPIVSRKLKYLRDQTILVNDKDLPVKEFNNDLNELREKDSSLAPENMTVEDYASAEM